MSDTQTPRQAVAKLSAAAQKSLGLPPDFQVYSAFPFAGMNLEASRTAMADQEFYWIENFLLTGPASLRTLRDRGPNLYTDPTRTIVYFAWYNIGAIQYVALFFSDGTASQVQQSNGVVTQISTATGTFYLPTGGFPIAQQSGSQFLLIGNNNTQNDYWIWDGMFLYGAGTVGPYQNGQIIDGGAGYSTVPSYTVYGGSGTGVTLTPVVNEGAVVSLTITNPGSGYLPGDVVQVAFSGGGSDDTPILTAVIGAGGIEFVTLVAGGSGYTNGTFALGFAGGGGSGAAGTFAVSAGVVTSVQLTLGGSGYGSAPTVSFAASAGGTGAAAVPALSSQGVASVTVVNGGTNLTGTPTITFVGGGGSGATAVATVSGDSITSVTMINGGGGYTSAPAVEVQTGLNNAAAAILQLMPFGVSGNSIETFLSRVWISAPAQIGTQPSGGVFSVSAPESLTDFATSDGGLLFTSSDRFLRVRYGNLRQSNGYLYTLGDSSVSVINNVQTAGSPPATTFNYQNASSQIGVGWRDTVQDYNQGILFANANGIQGLYGGSVRRVSGKINDLFANAIFPPNGSALIPSSAVANIYTIPVYLLLLTVIDPRTNQQRNVMVTWNEKEFTISSQTTALTFIGTQEANSVLTAWGTDGKSIFQLFAVPSAALTKTISTKLYGGEREFIVKNPLAVYFRFTDKSAAQSGVSGTITMEAAQVTLENGQAPFATVPPVAASGLVQPNFTAANSPCAVWSAIATPLPGTAIGETFTSTSPDFLLSGLSIAYADIDKIFD